MVQKSNFPLNGLRLCIDYDAEQLAGNFYSPVEKGEIDFQGLEDFLLKADQIFDKHGYPQAFMEKRVFQPEVQQGNRYKGIPAAVLGEDIRLHRGKLRTYNVIVMSRRNATWQGIVQQEDGNFLASYSGELELIEIIEQK